MYRLKTNRIVHKIYSKMMLFMKAYMPSVRAKIAYRIAYGKKCNLQNPQTVQAGERRDPRHPR